jgi:hypothetical protein
MTPKEKAENLVVKFLKHSRAEIDITPIQSAKQCALIAIDEMIVQNGELYLNSLGDKTIQFYAEKNGYLFEVKQEIQLL